MITKIQSYSLNSSYKPTFGAVIARKSYIPIKHRGEVLPKNIVPKFFARVKEVFFEMFPNLDPEYRKIANN